MNDNRAFMAPVPLEKAYRLINHGPTVLVSARHDGVENIMAAAWACGLDFAPPKVTVVIDKIARTRELLERSGTFVLQVPTVAQREMTYQLGTLSLHNEPEKLQRAGAELLEMEGVDAPLVAGCSAWLACKLIPEPHNQQQYDLFIGEVTAAWADTRVFREGRWRFEDAPAELRSLHHVAGGHFYAIGEAFARPDSDI
ncbi:flavin reductase family protein [Cronobacter muytjensii]|uniref:flavin reductase family protein n=1 Tax=Cronobacter muytjensii TaxID=413501 RepID=UPI0003A573C3|nr:flavin reductase family protein [Cronobacter muytjensii]ALB70725.1 flavin reductase [Cronobacter muytjensii ATCC 51329]EGT4337051.1 flavin reductase [Cronobacter muytjensii]EKS1844542.1 flavin reductase family protein [Cronobacter muytjensii]ELY4673192.1 flavin reductase family protein [Cronobacter muytjensii]